MVMPHFCNKKTIGFTYGSRKAVALSQKIPPFLLNYVSPTKDLENRKGGIFMSKSSSDLNSLAHTKWECKYHVVFAPKYRRRIIYGKIKAEIGKILRRLCEQRGIEIIEAELCPDHVHMLISVPPKVSVSSFMGYLKGKSTLMIFDKFANLKYKYGRRNFWAEGYFVSTVGKNEKKIKEYISNQLQDDIAQDQISIKEYIDPFAEDESEKKNWLKKPLKW